MSSENDRCCALVVEGVILSTVAAAATMVVAGDHNPNDPSFDAQVCQVVGQWGRDVAPVATNPIDRIE